MNRGARGWEPPKRQAQMPPEKPEVEVEQVESTDLVEHNGTWMTKEDAKRHG